MPDFGPVLADLQPGMGVTDLPVAVAEANAFRARNERPFARYVLRDATGSIPAIRWDYTLEDGEQGAVAWVTGQVGNYKGQTQLTVARLELIASPSAEVLARVVARPDPDRQARLVRVLEATRRALAPACWVLFREALGHDPFDLEAPFWTYAAGQSKHHAMAGGLAWHVLTMLTHVDALADAYPGLDVELLKLAVLTHDLGKLDCYEMGLAGASRLSLDKLVGHTSYSLARVHHAITRLRARGMAISAADEENLLHCIASHHGRIDWGAIAEPQTAEAAALHALDLLDAHVQGALESRREAPPDRRLLAATPRAAAEPGVPTQQPSLF
jgi:3'-5' exoribonuclease